MDQYHLPVPFSGLEEGQGKGKSKEAQESAQTKAMRRMTIGSTRPLKAPPSKSQPPPTPGKREKQFREHFSKLKEPFIDHFACSFQREGGTVQHQGRMFITASTIGFHATHPGGDFVTMLPFAEVSSIVKKNTVFLFPNAIWVSHTSGTDIYTGFFQRDKAFDILHGLWETASNATESRRTLIKQEPKATKPMPASGDSAGDVRGTLASSYGDGSHHSLAVLPTTAAVPVARSSLDDLDITPASPQRSPTDMTALRKRRRSMSAVHADGLSKSDVGPGTDAKDQGKSLRFSLDDKKVPGGATVASNAPVAEKKAHEEGAGAKAAPEEAAEGEKKEEGSEAEGTEVEKEVEEKVEMPPMGPCSHSVYSPAGLRGALVVEQSFNVDFEELCSKFFLDGTLYGSVMESIGSWDVVVPEWTHNEAPCHHKRLVTFVAPIKGAPIGPKQTKVEQTQTLSMMDENTVALSSSTFSLDIPYSDAFLVEATMLAKADGKGASKLEVYVFVNFKKSPWVKSIIEKKAKDDTQSFFVSLAQQMRESLAADRAKKGKEASSKRKGAAPTGARAKKKRRRRPEPRPPQAPVAAPPASSWSTVSIPMVDVEVPVKETLLLLFVLFLSGMLFVTWLDVRAVSHLASEWEQTYAEQEDRVAFMQLVACQLAHNVSGGVDNALELEWEHWRQGEAAEWRIAEWKERFASSLHELALALEATEQVSGDALRKLGSSFANTEQALREQLGIISDEKMLLEHPDHGGMGWLRLFGLTGGFLLLALGLCLACTVNLWEPMVKGFLSL